MFCLPEGHLKGHFIMLCQLEAYYTGHFITFYPLEGLPEEQFFTFCKIERQTLGGTLLNFDQWKGTSSHFVD